MGSVELVYFTTIGRGVDTPCLPATRNDWERLRKESWLQDMCAKIEKGNDELKRQLPVWTPSCVEYKDNRRSAVNAIKPLNRLMMDFDEKGHTNDIMAKLTNKDGQIVDVSDMKILLVEESARRGTHVLVELPEGMDADTAQQLMREATGFEPDVKVKGLDRCIYMVPMSHTRYVSERLFEPTIATNNFTNTVKQVNPSQSLVSTSAPKCSYRNDFKGIPYASIISEYWRRTGGVPTEGERNDKLHKLATNLRAICDDSEEWLFQVMPRLGLAEKEMRTIIHSACKEPTKGSKMMATIVSNLTMAMNNSDDEENEANEGSSTIVSIEWNKLPIGLKESLVGVPVNMRLPVLCAVLPLAGAYADQVEVKYCDGNFQKLGLMSIIRGEQASGKSVCKNAIEIWKRQFDEEDALARKREEEWKERKKNRKSNEKAPDDPKVLIRCVPVTVSCSTLLKRFKNANGHCLYSFGEELDTLRKTNGAGSWSSKYDIYRLSFDQGEWGQDYNSDQAESGVVKVAYNWSILGTNGAMRKCFKSDNIENGLSSRILVAEMPDSSFSKIPKYGQRSKDDEARIQEAVTRLRSITGFLDTPKLRKVIEEWVEQKRVEAAKDIDHVKDTYRRRAAVIGFRCGVIFRILEGKESKSCLDFALKMAEFTLAEQIKAFGEAMLNQYMEAGGDYKRSGVNHSIFDQLPDTFTKDDLRALKSGQCTEHSLRMITSRWKRDGWITRKENNIWIKTQHATRNTQH